MLFCPSPGHQILASYMVDSLSLSFPMKSNFTSPTRPGTGNLNLRQNRLFDYIQQKQSTIVVKLWMKTFIFLLWFQKQFTENVKAHCKIRCKKFSRYSLIIASGVFTFLWFHKEFNISYSTWLLIARRVHIRVWSRWLGNWNQMLNLQHSTSPNG